MNAQSLIFDIDGTLWDSRALVAQGYNLQLRAEGRDELCVDAERLRSLFGMTMTDIADRIFASVPTSERYALMERCMATENRFLAEADCHIGYPRVRETLAELKTRHRLFIVSNSQCGYPELCMEKLGVRELFSGWLCFGDTHTPKGQTIRTLMARYAISDAVYIGDTAADAQAARQAGAKFVWAAYGFGTATDFDAKIMRLSELSELL